MRTLILSLLSTLISFSIYGQQEVVIIGTMHTVPKKIKNAYKPMLKKAIKYRPQAIYVERQPSWDTVSVKNYFPDFYAKGDSIRKATEFDLGYLNTILDKNLDQMTKDEAAALSKYYYAHHDFANYEFYRRIKDYGVEGYKKPSRNENGDLTYPLAVAMGIKYIHSMDNQTYYSEYGRAWMACDSVGKVDGNYKHVEDGLKIFNKKERWHYLSLRSIGKLNNTPELALLAHRLNAMEYRTIPNADCEDGNYYFDYRNTQMVKNIATQMKASGDKRNIAIVGMGHLYGMVEAFERDYPEIKVIWYADMPDNSKIKLPIELKTYPIE